MSYTSPQGEIQSKWKTKSGMVTWTVTIPEKSSVLEQLPACQSNQIKLNDKKVKSNTFKLTSGE